ncbi:MAG TPA: hypothetical protein VHD62_11180 [Opitutaceae bacterium]|nr:hypothetical protein [Opitutaceae bacterium]
MKTNVADKLRGRHRDTLEGVIAEVQAELKKISVTRIKARALECKIRIPLLVPLPALRRGRSVGWWQFQLDQLKAGQNDLVTQCARFEAIQSAARAELRKQKKEAGHGR